MMTACGISGISGDSIPNRWGTKYKKGDRLVLPPEGMDICAAYEGLTSTSRLACFLEADRLAGEEMAIIEESRAG